MILLSPHEFLRYLSQHRDLFPPALLIEYSGLSRATVYRALRQEVGNIDTVMALAKAVERIAQVSCRVTIALAEKM